MINFRNAKIFCKDDISLIENYDKAIADKEQIWDCHHRKGTIVSRKELIKKNEYYNRPASELIFLTEYEHKSLHHKGNKNWLGRHHSEETRRKMSEAQQGNKNMLGKHHSEETRRKMSEAQKGKNTWIKDSHWFNNGTITVIAKSCPEGFVKGRLKKVKQI